MPACLAGQPLPAGADPYADHAWRQRLPVNPESRQFPVGVLLSSLSEIVAWSHRPLLRSPVCHCSALLLSLHVPRYLFAGSPRSLGFPLSPHWPSFLRSSDLRLFGPSRFCGTMASADFSQFVVTTRPFKLSLLLRACETSPGTHTFFLSIYLPHLPHMIPCSDWALTCLAALPSCAA